MGGCESTHSNSKDGGNDDQGLARIIEKEKEDQALKTLKVVGMVAAVAVGVVVVGWGLPKLLDALGEQSNKKKMMKAPGRDFHIFRDDFERDPSAYFRSIRK